MEGLPFCERKAFRAIGSRDTYTTIMGYAWTRRSAVGAELAGLYVHPRVQGKGVGKALISDALECLL
ncbi:GNAT family N-acetyltransferase [Catelliglobosispora koreensis]|uniref:GNAT family N-acetyltransferase n=1 Tax=Catelliglobosispora koreensis TaxID=129052 RepID=UPI0003A9E130